MRLSRSARVQEIQSPIHVIPSSHNIKETAICTDASCACDEGNAITANRFQNVLATGPRGRMTVRVRIFTRARGTMQRCRAELSRLQCSSEHNGSVARAHKGRGGWGREGWDGLKLSLVRCSAVGTPQETGAGDRLVLWSNRKLLSCPDMLLGITGGVGAGMGAISVTPRVCDISTRGTTEWR